MTDEALAGAAVPRRVWSATLLSALARQWGALCTFLSVIVLSRALAPADFGRFTFWLGVLTILDVLVDCGTSTVAVQRGAGDPRAFAAAIAAGRRLRFAAAVLGAFGLAVGAALGGERDLGWVCLAGLGPLARVPEMSAVVFQRDIAWGTPLLLRALGATGRLAVIAGLAAGTQLSFGPFLLVHSWGLALGNVALHFLARARLPARAAPLAGMLASALPLVALGLVQQGYAWADNAFVRAELGPAELGRYNAALWVFRWLAFFAAFATTSALPWLARRHADGALGPATARLAQPLFLGACVLAGLLAPWSGRLLALAFGPDFASAGASLAWLLATLVVLAPGAAFLTAVIAAGGARSALFVALLALLVSLGANALLVPRLGTEGAALARLAAEASVTLASFGVLRALGATPSGAPRRWLLGPLALAAAWLASSALVPR